MRTVGSTDERPAHFSNDSRRGLPAPSISREMPDVKGAHVERKLVVESGSPLPGTNRKPSSTETLARGPGKPIRWTPRPVRQAVQPRSQHHRGRAEALLRLLVNKRANRHAGPQSPRSRRATPAPKAAVQGDGPAPYRTEPTCTGRHTGGQNPPCACSEPHHPQAAAVGIGVRRPRPVAEKDASFGVRAAR